MMFADMIRTDLIAARMRTCIPYNICKWASFYLLANVFFFFPSFVLVPLVLWKLCRDRGTTTGQDGLLAPRDRG